STADVTVTFYNRSGTALLTLNQTIAPNAGIGLNTRTGGATFNPLGNAFEGHAVVTSNNGQPLAVVLNGIVRVPGGASGATNGIPE
ncbi:MAG: hypothetical protein RMN24_15380, partial [Anaerolineae bacterium]|nr:hypothetical protein [Anaerolineae bacterium]